MNQEALTRAQLEAWLVDLQAQVDAMGEVMIAMARGDEAQVEFVPADHDSEAKH